MSDSPALRRSDDWARLADLQRQLQALERGESVDRSDLMSARSVRMRMAGRRITEQVRDARADETRRGFVRLQEQMDDIMARITGTVDVADLADCDIVIEAVTENLELKQELWAALDKLCPSHTIFASNTSSILISLQAEVTDRKDRFIGMHFFNPVPVMKLVEIIRSDETSDETYDIVMSFAGVLGKDAVTCKDTYGFIVNRLLVPYLLDAVKALEAGIASKEDIDTGMRLGCGHPMGPLTLVDFVGLDTALYIANIMYDAFKEPHYQAPELLRKMVAEGKLGRKAGEGFYSYR